MRDIKTRFGDNAGKIWIALNKEGALKKNEIKKITKLNEVDFHAAVGWLSREDKIARFDNNYFKLGNTNLEREIGKNAGLIWKILDIWEEVDLEVIKNLSDLEKEKVHAAIGWLAREDKIKKNKNKYYLK